MQLVIDKIGKIEHAELNINGLTVIAGKNDTGKSTVGKVLYAIFRALEMGPVFFDYMKKTEILNEYVRPLCRKYIASPSADADLKQQLAQLLKISEIILTQEDSIDKLGKLNVPQLISLIENIERSLLGKNETDIVDYAQRAKQGLLAIQQASVEEKMAFNFERTFDVMFNGTVLNSKHKECGNCEIQQENNQVLCAKIVPDGLTVQLDPILTQSIFRDIVYVESPFVLERVQTKRKPHWNELKHALHRKAVPKNWTEETGNKQIVEFIQKNVLGKAQISFNEDLDDFVYQVDEQAEKLTMANVACGVKAFVLLLLLLKLNILKKETLLVLDEPENHLHPEFQIKYAQMITLLVKEGFSVVLTSHSPTFIQAVFAYSQKYKIESKTTYYLAEQLRGKNYSRFTNVSGQIEKITENLVSPMDKLFLGV